MLKGDPLLKVKHTTASLIARRNNQPAKNQYFMILKK
jgi:hypothetical protein